jgi:hypothetical protein
MSVVGALSHGIFATDGLPVGYVEPSVSDVRLGVGYGDAGTEFTGTFAGQVISVVDGDDQINSLLNRIDAHVRAGLTAESIKDGNIPLRNIWRGLEGDFNPRQLPLIQYDSEITAFNESYVTAHQVLVPFQIRFICWVSGKLNNRADRIRARDLRDALRRYLHSQNVFPAQGAARRTMQWRLETIPYHTPFSVGEGMTVTGDIIEEAG